MEPKKIQIEDYNYVLPEFRIAFKPTERRETSKLLVYRNGEISDVHFDRIFDQLPKKCSLWLNQTRVINARLWFKKPTGKIIEIFCLGPAEQSGDIQQGLASTEGVHWKCYVKGAKKWSNDLVLNSTVSVNGSPVKVSASKGDKIEDAFVIRFSWEGEASFGELLQVMGGIPLPPYIKREQEIADEERYQTVYASMNGSVAAPTAGLHFTDKILETFEASDIRVNYLTLHVGAGTFKPVTSNSMEEHHMHAEEFIVDEELIRNLLADTSIRIAVGTTSCRTLESVYWFGVKAFYNELNEDDLLLSQWYAYENGHPRLDMVSALNALLEWIVRTERKGFVFRTELLCAPGYAFRMVNGLITNFHMPKSTLILLVAALIGEDWRKVYTHALNTDYRFLSYGDSSLLIP